MPRVLPVAAKPQVSGEDSFSLNPQLLLSTTVMVLSIIVLLAQHLYMLLPPTVLDF